MKLPQRDENHVRETASFKIFERLIPDKWIVREVTERDYGIDCYIEICEDGQVSGKLLSVQIKSSDRVALRYDKRFVVYYNIDVASLNYWYLLPVPVLFLYIDITEECIYYLNIKQIIRKNYFSFQEEKIKSLKIPTENILDKKSCEKIINAIYHNEVGRREFEVILAKFLTSIPYTYEFLEKHGGRDCFLPLGSDDNDDFYFVSFYNEFMYLAERMGINWNIMPLKSIIAKGREKFRTGYDFYEYYITECVHQIIPIFLEIIHKSYQIICITEKEYWMEHNY